MHNSQTIPLLPPPSAMSGTVGNDASGLFFLDAGTYWLLSVSSSFMLAAAHNVLYFVLDIRTPVIHFLHYFVTFVFLFTKTAAAKQFPTLGKWLGPSQLAADYSRANTARVLLVLWPAVMSQAAVTLLSTQVHSQSRAGGLYMLRLFDFLTTLTVFKLSGLPESYAHQRGSYSRLGSLLIPVAIFASLSWLEFGHLEYDGWTLTLAPFLAIAQGVQVLLVKRAEGHFRAALGPGRRYHFKEGDEGEFEEFSLHYAGLVSVALVLPALISYSQSVISHDASWESIDYTLMGMSVVFMCGFKYAELWLITNLELCNYCIFEHSRYFLASCGQWYLQNMAHATIYAACGKALFLASLFRYWHGIKELDGRQSTTKRAAAPHKKLINAE